ncbi:alpha/beta fold hydrolase [Anaerosphaera multitolerans]|uniref:Alpha/beta hydrolase n=1 Tax=Anaerosphaera multitolerans TaxID=2487351 RepID=A0A437S4Z8_9FIRM|nr:alpha/beta hydrolase [Anaerosphaera multitolerans]RVU54064.1 alpha/beta hydrolase [Anaerosphaera multitolerans]
MNVFIHGLGQSSKVWDKTTSSIKKVYCPDLAFLLKNKEVNWKNLYSSLTEDLKKLPPPLNLCGLSLGGVLALNYALDFPTEVNSLILIGTQYKMPKNLLLFQNVIFKLLPNSAFNNMGFEKNDIIKLTRSMINLDFSKELISISCPSLILCGEKDRVNLKASEKLSKNISNSTFKIVRDSVHEVNKDNPEELSILIKEFLKI